MLKTILRNLNFSKNKTKRNKIKNVISSIIRFRILKRASLAKIKTKMVVFVGSTMLIITIIFTVCPSYPAYAIDNNTSEKASVSILIKRDIHIENAIIRHTITEQIFTDSVLGENILIEKNLWHTVENKNPV